MANMITDSEGPLALGSVWLDETSLEAGGRRCLPSELFRWQGAGGGDHLVGVDFAAEVESVSRLFPHLDGLPAELTGLAELTVAEQVAVCGETSVALGAGVYVTAPGSPADQCLMSPSDVLLASPDPSLAPSPARPEFTTAAADFKITSAAGVGFELRKLSYVPAESIAAEKITTLIDFVQPSSVHFTQTSASPADGFVSASDMETAPSPISEIAPSPSTETAPSYIHLRSPEIVEIAPSPTVEIAPSPAVEFVQFPVIDFASAPDAADEDEHARMIDQALEDLKTLENMCGITSDEPSPASASILENAPVREATASQAVASQPAAPAAGAVSVKSEPAEQETEIEIVEERLAPRRRRRRPPRVAVTPPAPTQIVIVLTSEQLAGIQQSGQLVLNAAALQSGVAPGTSGGQTQTVVKPRIAVKPQTIVKAQSKAQTIVKAHTSKAQTIVKAHTSKAQTIVKAQSSKVQTIVKAQSSKVQAIVKAQTSGKAHTIVKPSTSGKARTKRKAQTVVKQETAKKRCGLQQTSTEDPLSGWMEQKLPSAAWEYPLLPAADLEPGSAAEDAGIPDDLQDLLLDGADSVAVPALPGDAADTLLEELISGSVRENPQLFGGVELDGLESCSLDGVQWVEEQGPAGVASPPLLLCQSPAGFSLSPGPQQQVPFESWVPTLCPSPGEGPVSPASECSADLAPGPDWQPNPAARRRAARPRPYDKETVRPGVRRQPLSEEERRERKKEQNKNAATRYRQKKKEEHDLVSCDQDVLESRNKQLRERVGALGRELNYLKQLMREVLRHKRVGV